MEQQGYSSIGPRGLVGLELRNRVSPCLKNPSSLKYIYQHGPIVRISLLLDIILEYFFTVALVILSNCLFFSSHGIDNTRLDRVLLRSGHSRKTLVTFHLNCNFEGLYILKYPLIKEHQRYSLDKTKFCLPKKNSKCPL